MHRLDCTRTRAIPTAATTLAAAAVDQTGASVNQTGAPVEAAVAMVPGCRKDLSNVHTTSKGAHSDLKITI